MPSKTECEYTDNEKKYGMNSILLDIDECIKTNEESLKQEEVTPWNKRELEVLYLLKKAV